MWIIRSMFQLFLAHLDSTPLLLPVRNALSISGHFLHLGGSCEGLGAICTEIC